MHGSIAGMNGAIHEGFHFLLTALIAAMGIALLASAIMSSVFLRPIRSMQIAANHMAEGDYTITTGVASKDELGRWQRISIPWPVVWKQPYGRAGSSISSEKILCRTSHMSFARPSR